MKETEDNKNYKGGKEKIMKNYKGITLIALVVTIVVLLILAGTSIAMLSEENGIIKQAESTSNETMHAAVKESMILKYSDYNIQICNDVEYTDFIDYLTRKENGACLNANGEINVEKLTGGKHKLGKGAGGKDVYIIEKLTDKYDISYYEKNGVVRNILEISVSETKFNTIEFPDKWDETKVIAIDDGKGTPVPIPNGFFYLGGNIETGIVISDKENDTLDSSGIECGNQFVWIPINNENDLIRTTFDKETGLPIESNLVYYYEPASIYDTEQEEYYLMREQVLRYGGFYIARFEAGINTTELRTGETLAQKVVSKKGVAPYNYVSNESLESDVRGDYVHNLAQNMYSGSEVVTSTLIYGCQWDAMCRYLGYDCTRIATIKDSVELTGSDNSDKYKNIYYLAGNCWEWTMEYWDRGDTFSRTLRGGYCQEKFEHQISERNSDEYCDDSVYLYDFLVEYKTFRCALYIK